MVKHLTVASAQQVLNLLLDSGKTLRDVHRETGIALQTVSNIKLGRYPNVKESNYLLLVDMLGYFPDEPEVAESVHCPVEFVRGFLFSDEGARFVDRCRDGVIAA